MKQPLAGVRILDLSRLLPGGMATMMLADLGADVIKIESPDGGDYARWMPPMIDGQGAYFRATNRNKRSAIIDLKKEEGIEALKRLVASADVLVEGSRPGVMERLGCGYDALRSMQPRLIYCSISGWGQEGAYAQRSGHDLNYAAVAGLTGEMNTPQPTAGQTADIGGAYVAVSAICAALFGREKTGEGAYIDCALFDAAIPFFTVPWVEAVAQERESGEPRGRLTGKYACYNVYQTSDGEYAALAALEPKFWANFCKAVERPDLIADYEQPSRQRYLLIELQSIFGTKTAAEWSAALEDVDCCFSLVSKAESLAEHPQVKDRGVLGTAQDGSPFVRSPIRISGDEARNSAPPSYGADTRAVLREAGYRETEIDGLFRMGVIQG